MSPLRGSTGFHRHDGVVPWVGTHGYDCASATRLRYSGVGSIAPSGIDVADLRVESAEVVNDTDQQAATSHQIEQAGDPFAM